MPVAELAARSGGVPARACSPRSGRARAGPPARGAAADRRPSAPACARPRTVRGQGRRAAGGARARGRPRTATWRRRCPFKGLASFDLGTRRSSSGVSGSWPRWSRGLSGARLLAIVGPSGSGKSSALRAGLLAALTGGVLPGSEGWGRRCCAPASTRCARSSRRPPRPSRTAAAGRRRPVRRGLHRLRDEAERSGVRRRPRRARPAAALVVLVAVRADFYGRCAAYPELSRLLGADHVLVGPMRRDELRRAIELPAAARGPARRARARGALSPTLRTSQARCRCCRPRCWSCGSTATGGACGSPPTSAPAASDGAVARLAEGAYARLTSTRSTIARGILLRLAGEGEGDGVVRRRVPLEELADAGRRRGSRRARRRPAPSRSATARPRSRTRRCCVSGRACATGSRRTRRAVACTVTSTTAARDWDAGGRDAGELYRGARLAAALGLVGLTRCRAEPHRRARPSSNPQPRHERAGESPSAPGDRRHGGACLFSRWARSGSRCAERRHALEESVAAAAQRLDAQAFLEDELDRSLLHARQAVAMDDTAADARQPARGAGQEPGRDRRDARRRRPHVDRRSQPRRAHARRGRPVRQRLPLRHDRRARRVATFQSRATAMSWIVQAGVQPRRHAASRSRTTSRRGNVVDRVRQPQPRAPCVRTQACRRHRLRHLPAVFAADGTTSSTTIAATQDPEEGPALFVRYDARTGRRRARSRADQPPARVAAAGHERRHAGW